MSLINCEINLFLTSSEKCVIIYNDLANQGAMTNTTIYVPVVTLSTEDNAKLLQQLKSGFKITVNWNKHLPIPELLAKNLNLNHLVVTNFQGINRLFVLA